jgi:hypothetical protein
LKENKKKEKKRKRRKEKRKKENKRIEKKKKRRGRRRRGRRRRGMKRRGRRRRGRRRRGRRRRKREEEGEEEEEEEEEEGEEEGEEKRRGRRRRGRRRGIRRRGRRRKREEEGENLEVYKKQPISVSLLLRQFYIQFHNLQVIPPVRPVNQYIYHTVLHNTVTLLFGHHLRPIGQDTISPIQCPELYKKPPNSLHLYNTSHTTVYSYTIQTIQQSTVIQHKPYNSLQLHNKTIQQSTVTQ